MKSAHRSSQLRGHNAVTSVEMIDANTRVLVNEFGRFTQVRKKRHLGSRRQRGKPEWTTVESELFVEEGPCRVPLKSNG
jgi:hypothetical protein